MLSPTLLLAASIAALSLLGSPAAPSATGAAPRASADDGRIVADVPCRAMAPWDSVRAAMANPRGRSLLPTRAAYDSLVARVECRRLTYLSDGLKVTGYLYRPRGAERSGRRLPVVVVNRGGNRDFGQLPPTLPAYLWRLAREDWVILASQYRGNDGGEGEEEFGGADVNDVMALFPLAASLPYADTANAFMLGYSRGGMMTYLALARGAPVRAAAVWAGPTDLEAALAWRGDMENVYRELIPAYAARKSEALRERSAVAWAERIAAPVLVLHGTGDDRVPPSDALAIAARFQQLRKPYELVMYAGDDHGLTRNGADADARIVRWFERHMRR